MTCFVVKTCRLAMVQTLAVQSRMLLSTAVTMAQQLTAAPLTIALLVAAVILIMIKKVPPYLVILLAAISEIAAHWHLVIGS